MFDAASEAYMKKYYNENIWKTVLYRGVRTLKNVSDMWNYQEIFHQHDVQWVIETGSRHGGSGLYFADLLSARNADGCVYSIDVDRNSNTAPPHPRLHFIIGNSASNELVLSVFSNLPTKRGRLFVILDSDHSKQHVLNELNVFVPLMQRGDYLVVEDTCVNNHPVRPEHGEGPYEAIEQFVRNNPDSLTHDNSRENKFGFTFAPNGFYIKN